MPAAEDPGPALQRYALGELGVAIDALDAFGGRLHAGVHRARKAMRRSRAVLALGAGALGPGARLVDRALRRANRRLSDLRDAHALVETLARLLDRAEDTLQVHLRQALRAATTRRDAIGRDEACRRDVATVRAELATLHAALCGLPWDALSEDSIDTALARSAHRIDAARKRVSSTDADADWHDWRRRLRRLSQQRRALAEAGIAVGAASDFDRSLAEQLGALQDLQLLADHCGRRSPFAKPERHALAAFAREALQRQRRRLRSAGIDHAD